MFEQDDPLAPYKPAFQEAWQAEALALANSLVGAGVFSPNDWAMRLGDTLRHADEEGRPDNEETYYLCVLEALESLCAEGANISRSAQMERKEAWITAYEVTPHGEPVLLKREKAG